MQTSRTDSLNPNTRTRIPPRFMSPPPLGDNYPLTRGINLTVQTSQIVNYDPQLLSDLHV